jgi:hypothetical protein
MQKLILFFASVFLHYCVAAQVVKLTSGGTLKTTDGLLITFDNLNLENDGTINQAAGEGICLFKGNQNATISGTSLPVFDIVEVAKTSGAELSLLRSIQVTSGINFTSGLFNLNNNIVLLSPSGSLNGESETNRLYGSNGGYIEMTTVLNAPSSVNPGNLGAMITSSQNLGSTIIRRGHQSQPLVGGANSILRYFDIIPANNSSLNATLRIHYFDEELNGVDENTIEMWKSPDNINWSNQGYTARDNTFNYVEITGIADFSRWTLSSESGARPFTSVKSKESTVKNFLNYNDLKDQWKAWPNPANQTLSLTITSINESNAIVKIYDGKGSLITTQQFQLMTGNNHLIINIQKLPAGVYHLVTEWDNGKLKKSMRLVKL